MLFLGLMLTGHMMQADAQSHKPACFRLTHLQTEYLSQPMQIETPQPLLSWQVETADTVRGWMGASARIRVKDEVGQLVWDTLMTAAPDIALSVSYDGRPLQPCTRYDWTLELTDRQGEAAQASSWFETGLTVHNPTATGPAPTSTDAWHDARWIGGDGDNMVLYADYLPVFRLTGDIQLDKKSRSTRAALVYGAGDERLADPLLNPFGPAHATDESYVAIELDIAQVAAGGQARLRVLRAGYHPDDSPQKPLAEFDIARRLINDTNCYAPHRIRLSSVLGDTWLYVDNEPKEIGRINLNPLGQGGDFMAYPVLGDVGLRLPAGQKARLKNLEVSHYRSPSARIATVPVCTDWLEGGSKGLLHTEHPAEKGMPMLRTTFRIADKPIRKARLYATARGIYEAYVNGRRVADDFFAPGCTQYNRTHLYQIYDVDSLLQAGENALGAVLGEGWWSGGATFTGDNWNYFGDRQSLRAMLAVTYDDGSTQYVVTRPDLWQLSQEGPWRYGSFFQGEVYDATRARDFEGWATANYDASAWQPAAEVPLQGTVCTEDNMDKGCVGDYSAHQLTAQQAPAVQTVKRLTARSVRQVAPSAYIYDMGQNLAGVPRITFRGLKAGDVVRMRFAEVLYPDLPEYAGRTGQLMMENIRAAMATDRYTAAGTEEETFCPRFTFHGYRYVEISGLDHPLPLADVQAEALSSIHGFTAHYETSNPLVNQLWQNILWSARGNFLSIPTDCPQRNERMGWMGDISVFAPTATLMAWLPQFLRGYLQAVRDVQRPDSKFPDIAPLGGGFGGLLWGSAGITVPWQCHVRYADSALLREHYAAMSRYIDYVLTALVDSQTGLLVQYRQWGDLGDWLSPEDGRNDKSLLWEAYLIYDLQLMAQMAHALGQEDDARHYALLCQARKAFFRQHYLDPATGRTIHSAFIPEREGQLVDTQVSYVLPLAFDIVEEGPLRDKLVQNLVHTLTRTNRADDGTLCPPCTLLTGFIGTAWIAPVLSECGHADLAYRLLQQTEYPSWLYPVTQGATTIWERLNSYTHAKGFGGNNRMNSFNHYSFGAVGNWMLEHSLGIRPDEAKGGYRHFTLCPEADPTGQMTWASGHVDTMQGRICSSWHVEPDGISYTFQVPAACQAQLYLPTQDADRILESGKSVSQARGVEVIGVKQGKTVLKLTGGKYRFKVVKK